MGKIAITILAMLLALAAIVVVRTMMHQPESLADVARVDVVIDEQTVARHLAEAVRFKTVSHQNPADFDSSQFEGFIEWVIDPCLIRMAAAGRALA